MSAEPPALTLDDLLFVANMTVLHPLFAIWAPILSFIQGYAPNSWAFIISALYSAVTALLVLGPWSSRVWLNKSWRAGWSGLMGAAVVEWDQEVIVVTGGSGALGSILTETLAFAGATVVVLDMRKAAFEHANVWFVQCDLSETEDIERAFKIIRETVGDPTMLINNAALVLGQSLTQLRPDELQKAFSVNVLAQFATIRECLPGMVKAKKGHIVSVSSCFGYLGASRLSDYTSTKHAVIGLHESLSYEVAHLYPDLPIRTTLVCPGQLQSPMFASIKITSPLVKFLAPVISPHVVAKAIISALETRQSREIYLPWFTSAARAMPLYPSYAKQAIHKLSGADKAMDGFVARKDD